MIKLDFAIFISGHPRNHLMDIPYSPRETIIYCLPTISDVFIAFQ